VRELASFFVHDAGQVDAALGRRLLERAAPFPNDHALSPADVPSDDLESVLAAAESAGFSRLEQLETQAREDSHRQLERERAKLSAYFDYRDQAARDRLASSRRVLAGLEAADQAERRRIIPVWRANVARDERFVEELAAERIARLAQLEQRAASGGDLRLVAVARVEIVGSEAYERPDIALPASVGARSLAWQWLGGMDMRRSAGQRRVPAVGADRRRAQRSP
jgi:hypothetical protein